MKKVIAVVLALVATTMLLVGCMRNVKIVEEAYKAGEGVAKTYSVDISTAKAIAKQVLKGEEFEAIEDNGDYMKAVSINTYFAVYFSTEQQGTQVTAISRRRMATQILTTLSENSFHEQFDEAVAKLKKRG